MFSDNIPCVVYTSVFRRDENKEVVEDKIVLFYASSYREAKRVENRILKARPELCPVRSVEAWFNPNLQDYKENNK